jgi:hypothetical protein
MNLRQIETLKVGDVSANISEGVDTEGGSWFYAQFWTTEPSANDLLALRYHGQASSRSLEFLRRYVTERLNGTWDPITLSDQLKYLDEVQTLWKSTGDKYQTLGALWESPEAAELRKQYWPGKWGGSIEITGDS